MCCFNVQTVLNVCRICHVYTITDEIENIYICGFHMIASGSNFEQKSANLETDIWTTVYVEKYWQHFDT